METCFPIGLLTFLEPLDQEIGKFYVVQKRHPDEPFPSFRGSKSVDRRILCSSGTSRDGFESSEHVKGLVGMQRI